MILEIIMDWYHSIIRKLFKSSFSEELLKTRLIETQNRFIKLRKTVYTNKDNLINARTKKQRHELYNLLYEDSSPDIIYSTEISANTIKTSKITGTVKSRHAGQKSF